jgi:hypothetical protein
MWSSTPCKSAPTERRGRRERNAAVKQTAMPQRRTLLITGAAGLLAGLGWRARAWAQTAVPSEVAGELPGALWAGSARLRFFGLDVYDARLWVAPGFAAANYARHALALELTYLRSLTGSTIAERSLQEMARAQEITPAQAKRWLGAMQTAFPDVKSGDRLTGLHSPDLGARFWLNGQTRAAVPDPEFSRLFFGIWLSDATSEPRLRRNLLARITS